MGIMGGGRVCIYFGKAGWVMEGLIDWIGLAYGDRRNIASSV